MPLFRVCLKAGAPLVVEASRPALLRTIDKAGTSLLATVYPLAQGKPDFVLPRDLAAFAEAAKVELDMPPEHIRVIEAPHKSGAAMNTQYVYRRSRYLRSRGYSVINARRTANAELFKFTQAAIEFVLTYRSVTLPENAHAEA